MRHHHAISMAHILPQIFYIASFENSFIIPALTQRDAPNHPSTITLTGPPRNSLFRFSKYIYRARIQFVPRVNSVLTNELPSMDNKLFVSFGPESRDPAVNMLENCTQINGKAIAIQAKIDINATKYKRC